MELFDRYLLRLRSQHSRNCRSIGVGVDRSRRRFISSGGDRSRRGCTNRRRGWNRDRSRNARSVLVARGVLSVLLTAGTPALRATHHCATAVSRGAARTHHLAVKSHSTRVAAASAASVVPTVVSAVVSHAPRTDLVIHPTGNITPARWHSAARIAGIRADAPRMAASHSGNQHQGDAESWGGIPFPEVSTDEAVKV
jgi:hypothetical protein